MPDPSFPREVILWKEGTLPGIDITSLGSSLARMRPALEVKGPRDVWSSVSEGDIKRDFAEELAASRVFRIDLPKRKKGEVPLLGEIRVEERMIEGSAQPVGLLYDAGLLAGIYAAAIRESAGSEAFDTDTLHIVITYRLMGTFQKHDRSYHARTSFYALPCIVSSTGLVVAPAKPREYYLAKSFVKDGTSEEEILKALRGRYLDYEDERMTEVMKGYLLQALFYHATGSPFCDDPTCRLFNAHWQEEMLEAQLGGGKDLCKAHEEMISA
ncbi:MAG: DUF6775 family putative metallopeptidase [Candidatus Glassbacteria bacterium]